MTLTQIINEISEKAKGQFKPDLKKYGRNFRAISESAVLDVLNPLFKEYNITYEPIIEKNDLRIERIAAGRDLSGNLIERLVFVATVVVILRLHNPDYHDEANLNHESLDFYGYGSGVDSGDKATGKAYTAAVKYALFKGFRLQYSDDPDAEASEDIESIVEAAKEPAREQKPHKSKEEKEPIATEAQLNYVKGLVVACGLTDDDFKAKFGFFPYDSNIPMRKAREIIDELKKLQDEKLPF